MILNFQYKCFPNLMNSIIKAILILFIIIISLVDIPFVVIMSIWAYNINQSEIIDSKLLNFNIIESINCPNNRVLKIESINENEYCNIGPLCQRKEEDYINCYGINVHNELNHKNGTIHLEECMTVYMDYMTKNKSVLDDCNFVPKLSTGLFIIFLINMIPMSLLFINRKYIYKKTDSYFLLF